mgnify:CR=1 FL=1
MFYSQSGDPLGGFLVDSLSWRWVFYVNIVPGLLAAAFVACGLCVSALTESQLVASAATYGLLLFFWVVTWNEAAVNEVSRATESGRHTTSTASLYRLPGGGVA